MVVEAIIIGLPGVLLARDIPLVSNIPSHGRPTPQFPISIDLEVLPVYKFAVGRGETILSFGWAMVNRGMTRRTNGFYYDVEEVSIGVFELKANIVMNKLTWYCKM